MKNYIIAVLLALFASSVYGQHKKPDINIVFIGNSITQGAQLSDPATEAPPATTVAYLQKQKNLGAINFSNQGHSGYTTLDFLPGTDTFAKVEEAANSFADKNALLIFSIKLGTNDSAIQGPHGAPVAPEAYQNNIKAIADKLLTDFPRAIIIFQHPLWYSPNTYNGARYLQEGLNRLQSYLPLINSLVDSYATTQPKRVFVGDTKAFGYFEKNHLTDLTPENGRQGTFYLHPNKKGAEALGVFWGQAINKIIKRNF
ncbi:lysophospholipase L1-like esterase [Mucilaginibacter oryzae]|uniref:Lysophospholipase L1-like esterase n=1 Tax=Mucilaginibacter oryzae TaxID=468058 RepID=A0A316GZV5_9SPHI|nr:GDSL-type esterase/lipase family protein [Mucilaginibacter oryzae]PWK70869.1 lysophospholipase L1-like esterase [Mucilaginibacter oryzae]